MYLVVNYDRYLNKRKVFIKIYFRLLQLPNFNIKLKKKLFKSKMCVIRCIKLFGLLRYVLSPHKIYAEYAEAIISLNFRYFI